MTDQPMETSHGFASGLSAEVAHATPPDLVTWLREQIDEDERVARVVLADLKARTLEPLLSHDLRRTEGNTTTITRVVAYDPGRVLREVEAKRRTIRRCEQAIREEGIPGEDGQEQLAEDLLRLLALPYADRPGYREEWRP